MPIIKNAGYMWHRKYVDWQSGNELIGFPVEKADKCVNFANQAGIYALYDKDFRCVYVGQAGRGELKGLYHRLKDHAITDYLFCRWERFSWYGFYSEKCLEENSYDKEYKVNTEVNVVLDLVESLIIRVNPPNMNVAMGSLPGIKWFYQEAEFEEQAFEYEQLKKKFESMKKK
ncbi:MAG: GIY-YIG nuclease family protein [Nitrospira sp.]|nr:GIY-YIG nuclease family protein [Nitrospira sp.]